MACQFYGKKYGKYFWAGIGILLFAIVILFEFQGARRFSSPTVVAGRPTNSAQAGALGMSVAARRGVSDGRGSIRSSKPRILERYGKLPMTFEANWGQTDGRVKFLSRGRGYTVFLTVREAVLALQPASDAAQPFVQENGIWRNAGAAFLPAVWAWSRAEYKTEQVDGGRSPAVLRMRLVGANTAAQPEGLRELPGKRNYFIGNDPKKWHRRVPTYAQVRYKDAYPGIDLVYYGNQGQLEYDFVVAPGASPKAITLAMTSTGDKPLRINEAGDLVASLDERQVHFLKPLVYQGSGTEKAYVDGQYVLKGQHNVAFEIGSYDHSKALIIDPTLSYSTYLGGSGDDDGYGIAVDSAGNAYVTGQTVSTDFPTSNAWQPTKGGAYDAFVAALDPTGTTLLYSTYLGGSANDVGHGIAVDSVGDAYVTGFTLSTDFPTSNPLQPTNHGGTDAFVAKFDPTGATLLYSTYLGGSFQDTGLGVAVDGAGYAYVTGYTNSINFPHVESFAAYEPWFLRRLRGCDHTLNSLNRNAMHERLAHSQSRQSRWGANPGNCRGLGTGFSGSERLSNSYTCNGGVPGSTAA